MNTLNSIAGLAFKLHCLMKRRMLKTLTQSEEINLLHINVLGIVSEHKGITMKELAGLLGITAPSATSLVDRLTRDGVLERKQDPTNRRIVRVSISAKGKKELLNKMTKAKKAVVNVLSVLSEKDQKDLERIFGTLLKSLEEK